MPVILLNKCCGQKVMRCDLGVTQWRKCQDERERKKEKSALVIDLAEKTIRGLVLFFGRNEHLGTSNFYGFIEISEFFFPRQDFKSAYGVGTREVRDTVGQPQESNNSQHTGAPKGRTCWYRIRVHNLRGSESVPYLLPVAVAQTVKQPRQVNWTRVVWMINLNLLMVDRVFVQVVVRSYAVDSFWDALTGVIRWLNDQCSECSPIQPILCQSR